MYLLFVVSFIHLHICSTSTEGEAAPRAGILLQRFSASLFGTGHGDQTAHGRKRPSVRSVWSPSVSLLTWESVRLPCVSVCVDSPSVFISVWLLHFLHSAFSCITPHSSVLCECKYKTWMKTCLRKKSLFPFPFTFQNISFASVIFSVVALISRRSVTLMNLQ